MSVIGIGGQGIPLPYPANNYGYSPFGGSNEIDMPAGGVYTIPSGTWAILPGLYTWVQFLDPISGRWMTYSSQSPLTQLIVNSDGYNWRLANLTGCMAGAKVTNVGSGYTSAPAVSASAGGSLWTAIVGGAVGAVTVGTAGSGYTFAPMVFFSAPAAGGVQATGYATLSAGAVASVTVTNQGAGYATAPTITLVSNLLDPNAAGITVAKATCVLTGAGTICAVLCTNPGAPTTALPTLSFAGGGGTSATAVAIGVYTATAVATTGTAGAGFANSTAYVATAYGGINTTANGAVVNTKIGTGLFTPRQGNFGLVTSSGAGAVANTTFGIVDGGIYQSIPTTVLDGPSTTTPTTNVTFTATYGGAPDTCIIQPLL